MIDLAFPIIATGQLPSEHGKPLHGALSRLLPECFHGESTIGVHPIAGRQAGNRKLMLLPQSKLVIRAPVESIAPLLSLTAKTLDVAGTKLRLGAPTVLPLAPAPVLRCRLLTIKLDEPTDRQQFVDACRRKLDSLLVEKNISIELGDKTRTINIHGREIIGFPVVLRDVPLDDSLVIQAATTWSRRAMGCGIFVPFVSWKCT